MPKRKLTSEKLSPVKPNKKFHIKMFKLSQQAATLLAKSITPSAKPMRPFGGVSQEKVSLLTAIGNVRVLFLWPFLIGIGLTLYWQVTDLHNGWKIEEKSFIRTIEFRKKEYGEDYFEKLEKKYEGKDAKVEEYDFSSKNIEKSRLRDYRMIENGKMPLKTYLNYRYYEVSAADRLRRGDTVLAIIYAIVIPALLIAIISFRRKAPLYFDPKRRLVYSWRNGKVWAQRYDDLIYYTGGTLDFMLFSFDKKGEFKIKHYVTTPSGNLFFNSADSYEKMMTYLTHYMEKGMDSVATKPWRGRRGIYLFNDKKPQDFDEQLDAILNYIDANNINQEVMEIANEWGWLLPNEREKESEQEN